MTTQRSSILATIGSRKHLLIALLTYHPGDPGWSYSGPTGEVRNTGGVAGAWFADIALYLFGYMAFLFPVLVAYGGWLATRRTLPDGGIDWPHLGLRLAGFVVTMAAGSKRGQSGSGDPGCHHEL